MAAVLGHTGMGIPGGDRHSDGREHLLGVPWCLLQEHGVMAGIPPAASWWKGWDITRSRAAERWTYL